MSPNFKFNLLAITIFLFVLHPVSSQELVRVTPEEVGMSSERLGRVTGVFNEYVEAGKIAGSVILVMRKGKVAYFEAFGYRNVEDKLKMERNTIFRIASQTKAITSVGIMMLQEQGKLLISDPLSKYIPEFEKTKVAVQKENESEYEIVDANRQITIRDLLTHTAGIGYGWGLAQKEWEDAGILGWYFADRDEPISTTVGRMASLPMSEQPGQKFVYGYGTDILGVVIERASGMPLDAFIELNILKLLGMEDTYFYLPPQKANRLSVVYSATNAGGITKAPDPGKMIGQGAYLEGPRKSFSGGAGLLSTAEDFARFLLMMFNEGELNGHRLLASSTIKLMTSNHLRDIPYSPGRGFGLGFEVVLDAGSRGIPGSVGEYGWGGAYGSNYWVDPEEKLIIVYFKQLIPTNGLDDAGKLRSLIYQAIVD